MKRRTLGIVVASVASIILLGYVFRDELVRLTLQPTDSSISERQDTDGRQESVVEQNLVTPWSITFLPSGDMLVTERSGQMKRFGDNGQTYDISGVRETSEGGLLGVALHPEFEDNNYIYLYFTTDENGGLSNRIERYEFDADSLKNRTEILADIPAAPNHNGGDIGFGPDEKLYVTTGDAQQSELAQDKESLAGKVLRLDPDGSTPADNPFGNEVWSYGHRNPQGITWDGDGNLWSTEHGPSGTESGRDELNLITKGGNYGWPEITGDETREGMIAPVVQSGEEDTWAPAGLAYLNGTLYFTGLRGQSLYEAKIGSSGTDVTLKRSLTDAYGRLRAITAHENNLYVSTSNRDGRGSPSENDDKIIRLSDL